MCVCVRVCVCVCVAWVRLHDLEPKGRHSREGVQGGVVQ